MNETSVVAVIRAYLKSLGATSYKYHGSVYGVLGHSDLYGTLPGGQAYYFEVKKPGGKTTARRAASQKNFRDAEAMRGAIVGRVESVTDVEHFLLGYLTAHPLT